MKLGGEGLYAKFRSSGLEAPFSRLPRLPGAERRETDWRGFRELVRDLARGSEDAFAVARWLRRVLEAGAEVPRLPLEAGDAVTLTTVHGSKGLEWPVVVLPDLDRRVPPRSEPVLYAPELGVSVDLGGDEEEPVLHRLISDRKATLEEAELRRLMHNSEADLFPLID